MVKWWININIQNLLGLLLLCESLPLLSCQIRIFQTLPKLVSVAIWKMSSALRAKAPLLSRWRCPLRLSRPYKLIPTWAVVPGWKREAVCMNSLHFLRLKFELELLWFALFSVIHTMLQWHMTLILNMGKVSKMTSKPHLPVTSFYLTCPLVPASFHLDLIFKESISSTEWNHTSPP